MWLHLLVRRSFQNLCIRRVSDICNACNLEHSLRVVVSSVRLVGVVGTAA